MYGVYEEVMTWRNCHVAFSFVFGIFCIGLGQLVSHTM